MRDPRAIVPVCYFAKLVCTHLLESLNICCIVTFDGNLCRHPTHGMRVATVAGLDEQE